MNRIFSRKRTALTNKTLIGLCEVPGRYTKPCIFCKKYATKRNVDKGFARIGIEGLGGLWINELPRALIELIAKGELIKINIAVKDGHLHTRSESDILGDL